jgi:exodeoxyribonuclease VIII
MEFGTAVHTRVLEYDAFDDRYIVAPASMDRRTKAGKEAHAELEASGKIVLSADDFDRIRYIADSVWNHPTASDILSEGQTEVSVMENVDGTMVRGRADWFRPSILADLKTTSDGSPEEFGRSVAKFRYHVQDAVYTDLFARAGELITNFFFIVVETAQPYATVVYELDEEAKSLGQYLYERDLQTYRECIEKNEWPGYQTGVNTLKLPGWALRSRNG